MRHSFLSTALAYLATTSFITLSSASPAPLASPSVRTAYQFPEKTWIENIAARSNGHLVVTLSTSPELHTIDPLSNPPSASLVHSFSNSEYNYTGLLGITELEPDVFAFVAGAIVQPSKPGFFSIWKADLSGETAKVSKIADVPIGQLLNGICAINSYTLLIADSISGNLIKLDTRTGKSLVLVDDPSMKSGTNDKGFVTGINGVNYHKATEQLYFTNSFLGKLFRVKLDCETGEATGQIETVVDGLSGPDDFYVAEDGTVYLAQSATNEIVKVEGDGKVEIVAGSLNSMDVPGPTSVTRGRTSKNQNTIYVSTKPSGAKVVAINVKEVAGCTV